MPEDDSRGGISSDEPASVIKTDDLRVLFVEDAPDEVELAVHQLQRNGIGCVHQRVETEQQLREALRDFGPDLILSDFRLPRFDGQSALRIAHEVAPNIPFIFLSGTIGEERAIQALLHGAADYVLKENMKRLVPAVRRALERAATAAERRRQDQQIERLTRVLRMLSGINSLIVRVRGRTELLEEACRLAVTVGRYSSAIVMLRQPGTALLEPIVWSGVDAEMTDKLRRTVAHVTEKGGGPITRVLKSGVPFVCNAPIDPLATMSVNSMMIETGFQSVVALPLLQDKAVVAVLMLTSPAAGMVSEEELQMLREVSANLSFALQYLHKDSTVRLLSHFDPLTGLARRGLFCERLGQKLQEALRDRVLGVGVFDIEQLSAINDSFGRHIGDQLLQNIADRLRRRVLDTEVLAHLGGGAFAIALEAAAGSDLSQILRTHLDAVFEHAFDMDGRQIPVMARSGLAVYSATHTDVNVLVQGAESALRTAQAKGRRHHHYTREQHAAVVARLALEHKLRKALQLRQFELHYQPKVGVRSLRIEGAEALIRWRDPDAGLVSPAAFLPLLETSGLIVDVGDWVIGQAATDSRHWQHLGLPPIRVAVNISAVQLCCADFTRRFLQLARLHPSDSCGLDIEITESMLLEDSATELTKLQELRAAGVCVAIDDFGTGYSSLSRLSELPIDTLKIDRSFVNRMPQDHSGKTLVQTIVGLARAFKMDTVAEGVETVAQLDVLREIGCDQLQGYLISKPVTRDAFASLLADDNGHMLLPPP